MPVPVAFGGGGVAVLVAAFAAQQPAAALFAVPFLVGAGVFQAGAVKPVEVAEPGAAVASTWSAKASPTMRRVRDDVAATRYFEGTQLAAALTEVGLSGIGAGPTTTLARAEVVADGPGDVALRLVFACPELPFSDWERKVPALAALFEADVVAVAKVSQADRLVALDISTRARVETVAAHEAEHAHDHDHAAACDGCENPNCAKKTEAPAAKDEVYAR